VNQEFTVMFLQRRQTQMLLGAVVLFFSTTSMAQKIHKATIAQFSNGNFVGAGLHDQHAAVYNSQKEKISDYVSIPLRDAYIPGSVVNTQLLLNEKIYVAISSGAVKKAKLVTLHEDGTVQQLELGARFLTSMVAVGAQTILVSGQDGSVSLVDVANQSILKTVTLPEAPYILKSAVGQIYAVTGFGSTKLHHIQSPENLENIKTISLASWMESEHKYEQFLSGNSVAFENGSMALISKYHLVWFQDLANGKSQSVVRLSDYLPRKILKDQRILVTSGNYDIHVMDSNGKIRTAVADIAGYLEERSSSQESLQNSSSEMEQGCLPRYAKLIRGNKIAGGIFKAAAVGLTVLNPVVMIPGIVLAKAADKKGLKDKENISMTSAQKLLIASKIVQDAYGTESSPELELLLRLVRPFREDVQTVESLKKLLKAADQSQNLCGAEKRFEQFDDLAVRLIERDI
jgi:hypothetical protein